MRLRRLKGAGVLDGMVNRSATDCALQMGSNGLVYLIHGVTGAPVEMHYLAKSLARHGWDVYATTLPGHCMRVRDLVRTTEGDWRAHVHTQLTFARERYDSVFVAGLSAGGLLALEASTVVDVDGVGVMSPTFVYDGWNTPWSNAILPLAMKVVPLFLQHVLFHIDGPPFGIKDPVLQARVRAAYRPTAIFREWMRDAWLRRHGHGAGDPVPSAAANGYPIFPLRTLTEIDRLIVRVRSRLSAVTAPTAILQAQEDDMTSPRNATIVYDTIASKEKRLVLLDDCYHVMTVDRQKHVVAASLAEFFTRHTSAHERNHGFSREKSEYGIR
ncbi:MAG TPA: alpha/beta fold hydrolase [Nitrospiraceae bacterium]|nr:alpha/beta fold hydrolase [Nitrospiraceae bacterium]